MIQVVLITVALIAGFTSRASAGVTDVRAEHRNGQTFLTFTESSPTARYDVFRSASPITSLNGLVRVADLASDSGLYRYTQRGFVICDLCPPLSGDTGLLVWTPAVSGTYYYAVRVQGESEFVAVGPIVEWHQAVPGVVLTDDWTQPLGAGTDRYRKYFAWQPHDTWEHRNWGYYGHEFVLTQAASAYPMASGVKYPLTLNLHAAGGNGYVAPSGYLNINAKGFYVSPRDEQFAFLDDAYAEVNPAYRPQTFWTGYLNEAGTIFHPVTETRVVNYLRAIAATTEYQIDQNRIYVTGASMGGMGMHIAYHYPALFAAAENSISFPSYHANTATDHCNQPVPAGNVPVGSPSGPLRRTAYLDLGVTVQQAVSLPPMLHTWGTEDELVEPCSHVLAIQAAEAAKQAYIAQWKVQGHVPFFFLESDGSSYYFRFRKDEAYPAFSSVSNNDDVAVRSAGPKGSPANADGQQNRHMDWSSSLRAFGAPIVDSNNGFGISLRSLMGDATARVTLRNTQRFRPAPGQVVTWQNVSLADGHVLDQGSVGVGASGLVTINTQVVAAGSRLTVSCPGCEQAGLPPAPPSNVRLQGQ